MVHNYDITEKCIAVGYGICFDLIMIKYLVYCITDPGDKETRVPCYPWSWAFL